MSQQPDQDFNIDDSSFQQPQIAQAGGNLHQIQNTNIYSLLNLDRLVRPRLVRPSNQEDFHSRKILLNKVKQYWVRDLLEKSLHQKALIELGLEERLDAVERPSEIAQEDKSYFRQPLPKDKSNIDVFKQMDVGRTLLILGAPGAGKTTFLLRLAKNLIADAEENLSLPIPVVFNLSSWKSKRQDIVNWLIQELNTKYKVSKSFAKSWIQNQQLLLLLDGLDEVKAEYRDACVQALNEFMKNYGETEMVICSRITDYELLSHRLSMQRGICIQSLTIEQINQYLDRAGNQLQAVKTLLQTDTALQELVKSPLMLSIITLAYQNISIEDLPKANSAEEHRKYLFNSYIQRMFNRRGTNKLYLEKQARVWLTWLAYKMSQESQTIFSIEQIQPRWLESKFQKLIYRFGFILLSSLTIALIGTLLITVLYVILKFFALVKVSIFELELRFFQKAFEKENIIENHTLSYLLLGLFWGFTSVVNSWLSNKEEIILSTETWRWSREKAARGIVSGAKVGLISGILLGLFILLFPIVSGGATLPLYLYLSLSLSPLDDNIFSNKLIGLLVSLISGFIFALGLKIIKKFFNSYIIKFTIRISKLYSDFKKILIWGVVGGILIWIISLLLPVIYMSLLIQITVLTLLFLLLFGLPFALIGGIIGALIGGQNSVNIQKEIVPVNSLRQLLIKTGVWSVIGGLISGVIHGVILLLNGISILEQNDNSDAILDICSTGIFFGLIFGLFLGFACIQHFTLRLILYRNKYTPWNYTHFLEFATERIFLQKIGSGYIFVHRLLQEHFAALRQPYQSSSIEITLFRTRRKKVFSFLLIGITILSVVVGYLFREKGEYYIERAIKYLGDQNRTIEYYSRTIRENPNDASSFFNRGDAYYNKKDYDRAIADYTQAITLDRKYTYAYNGRGNAYYNKKDYDRAITDYTQAITLDRKFTYAHYSRGNAYYNKKDYDRAIADYTQAITLNPKYTDAHYSRGNAYYNKKDYDRAIADYTQAIALDRKYTYAYYWRGVAYYYKKDYDRAITDYTQAITLNPKYTDAHYSRGVAYNHKKDYDRAIADYTQAITLNPKYTDAHYSRGVAYNHKKDYDRAIADYTQAITLNPKYTYAYRNRGDAYRKKKDYDRAIADYTQAITLDPKYTYAYYNRGFAYKSKGSKENSIRDFQKVLELTNDKELRQQAQQQLQQLGTK